ncbi:response regulator transcription factor [Nonomuraea bangladeshensis]|uniref:response regulator transcription factor n=1 Tax=Nonomuraea bangladeshensis TaxID=404385 RepID=UPI003C2B97EC
MRDARTTPASSGNTIHRAVDAASRRKSTPAQSPARGREEARQELARLTEREREVAIEVARGRSNTEIAERLYMSTATVKANVTRIFAKLGTDNRVQVAMKVRDAGFV